MPRDLQKVPKAHLHLHLEGAMRPETLTELCAKYGIERPADTRGKRFPGFGPFVSTYAAACDCLREEADLERLITEVAEDAKADGALWIEVAPSLESYAQNFGGIPGALKTLLMLASSIEQQTGVGIGFIISIARHEPPAAAEELARAVRAEVDAGCTRIVGFGLHADEEGNPPEPFAGAFEIACGGTSPVLPMPHAGEIAPVPGGGPASVRFCVEALGARRIAHGVLAAQDGHSPSDSLRPLFEPFCHALHRSFSCTLG